MAALREQLEVQSAAQMGAQTGPEMVSDAAPEPAHDSMPVSELAPLSEGADEHKGLLLVGLFKMSKALFFCCLGAGALHLVHHSLGDLVAHVVDKLPIDPEGRFVGFIMDRSDLIDGHQLRQVSMFSFGYSVLCIVEGTGLLLGRTWAEYFTVFLTVLGLPVELFEIARSFAWIKLGALVVNIIVLAYLLWVLKRKREDEAARDQRHVAGAA